MFRSVPWVGGKGSLEEEDKGMRGCWMLAPLTRDKMDSDASSFSFVPSIMLLHLRNVYATNDAGVRSARKANEGMEK